MTPSAKEGIIRNVLVLQLKLSDILKNGEVNKTVIREAIEHMNRCMEEIEKITTINTPFVEAIKEL